jgi:hypothetical protein
MAATFKIPKKEELRDDAPPSESSHTTTVEPTIKRIYACEGITDANIQIYSRENDLSLDRGRLNASDMNKLKVTLFPYKDWEHANKCKFTREELTKLAYGVEIPMEFKGKGKGTRNKRPDKWTEEEDRYWEDAVMATRRWIVEPGRVRAVACKKRSGRAGVACGQCENLWINVSFKAQLRKVSFTLTSAAWF